MAFRPAGQWRQFVFHMAKARREFGTKGFDASPSRPKRRRGAAREHKWDLIPNFRAMLRRKELDTEVAFGCKPDSVRLFLEPSPLVHQKPQNSAEGCGQTERHFRAADQAGPPENILEFRRG